VKEGSALLVALALAAGIAYWSDHFRLGSWNQDVPGEPAFPHQTPPPRVSTPVEQTAPERLEISVSSDAAAKAVLCEELAEVIRGVDAAMLTPQSPATTEQLATRRRAYVEKRVALGC